MILEVRMKSENIIEIVCCKEEYTHLISSLSSDTDFIFCNTVEDKAVILNRSEIESIEEIG